jgi:hypothetical protein
MTAKRIKIGTILLLFNIFIYASCKNKENLKILNSKSNVEKTESLKDTIILNTPNELSVNKIFKAKLKFESVLDSINLNNDDKRFTVFYLSIDSFEVSDLDQLKLIKHKAFVLEEKGEIELDLIFENVGLNYITGIIEDEVYLDNYKDGKTRIITHLIKIVKEINITPTTNIPNKI